MAGAKKRRGTTEATAAEMILRVDEVLRIRLDGAQYHDVVQYASEKEWGVTPRQVGNYIRKADDLIAERTDKRRKRRIALHMARRESLYGRSVNAADYRTALAVLSDLAKLQGLYPAALPPKSDGADIVGDLLREAVRRGLEAGGAAKSGPTGGGPGQPGGPGGGGPAADVADAPPPRPD